jgi:HlyD family secretion protein
VKGFWYAANDRYRDFEGCELNMEVEVDVNENDIVKIKVGDAAKVEVDAYLKKQFKGIVTSISNSASSSLTADQVTNFKVK